MNFCKGSLTENVLENGIIFEKRELWASARHSGEECVRGDPGVILPLRGRKCQLWDAKSQCLVL